MRNFCDRRVRWPQARLIWLGWLWKSLAYAQKLGSGRPFEEVQVGHYLQARRLYHPNLPRLHQHPCQYSLSGSDVQPGDSASDDIWGFLESRLNACGGIGCTDCRLFVLLGYLSEQQLLPTSFELNPKVHFFMLELKDNPEGLGNLCSLYFTVIIRLWSQRGGWDQGG